jgi:hypothetical protein
MFFNIFNKEENSRFDCVFQRIDILEWTMVSKTDDISRKSTPFLMLEMAQTNTNIQICTNEQDLHKQTICTNRQDLHKQMIFAQICFSICDLELSLRMFVKMCKICTNW